MWCQYNYFTAPKQVGATEDWIAEADVPLLFASASIQRREQGEQEVAGGRTTYEEECLSNVSGWRRLTIDLRSHVCNRRESATVVRCVSSICKSSVYYWSRTNGSFWASSHLRISFRVDYSLLKLWTGRPVFF